MVRVSGRGIDLSPRTEGQRGREERSGVRCTLLCQKVSELTGRTEIHQPRMHCMRGRQKYYRYTHSSTGYEPSVGSVTRPPQFRHQARRNCNSRKDPYIPPNASEACSHVARRRRCRQLLTCVAIATARAGATPALFVSPRLHLSRALGAPPASAARPHACLHAAAHAR